MVHIEYKQAGPDEVVEKDEHDRCDSARRTNNGRLVNYVRNLEKANLTDDKLTPSENVDSKRFESIFEFEDIIIGIPLESNENNDPIMFFIPEEENNISKDKVGNRLYFCNGAEISLSEEGQNDEEQRLNQDSEGWLKKQYFADRMASLYIYIATKDASFSAPQCSSHSE